MLSERPYPGQLWKHDSTRVLVVAVHPNSVTYAEAPPCSLCDAAHIRCGAARYSPRTETGQPGPEVQDAEPLSVTE
jgi:hypothetical protein